MVEEQPFKYQKELKYARYLPYYEELTQEANDHLHTIKNGINQSIINREVRPSLLHWACELDKYLHLNGLRFSKNEHVSFVNTFYQLIIMPNLELRIVKAFCQILINLLKKEYLLSREDVQFDWRPIYELYKFVTYKSLEEDGLFLLPDDISQVLENLISQLRNYFPIEATRAILAEFRPLLCPWDSSMAKGCQLLNLFLPSRLAPEEHAKFGYTLWLHEVRYWLFKGDSSLPYHTYLLNLLMRLVVQNVGCTDFNDNLPDIFNFILRRFKLKVSNNAIEIGSSNGQKTEWGTVAQFLVYNMGNGSSVQSHLHKLFATLDSYLHPSNSGSWQVQILDFMQNLAFMMCKRLHRERYSKASWLQPIPDNFKLTKREIDQFVESLLPCALTAMFCKTRPDIASNCMRYLSHLSPELVVPVVMDKVYPALDTLIEPHRLLQSLTALLSVIPAAVRDATSLNLRRHVVPLMNGLMPGMDFNDVSKSLLSLQALSMFCLLVPIVDCSEAVHVRDDLNQEEKEICSATAMFDSYVNTYMDRLFLITEAISGTGGAAGTISRRRGSSVKFNLEEQTFKNGLYGSFRSLLSNCSSEIYNTVVSRFYNYLNETILEGKIAAEILGELCFSVVRTNPRASFKRFATLMIKKLRVLVSDEHFDPKEDDPTVLWYLTMCSQVVRCDGDVLAEEKSTILEMLDLFTTLSSKEACDKIGQLLENLCLSLSFMYICEQDRDRDRLDAPIEESLPVRFWGEMFNIRDYKPKWHLPGDKQLDLVEKIHKKFLYNQLDMLECPETLKKEEIERCLKYILSCLIGSSSLLPLLDGKIVQSVKSSIQLSQRVFTTHRMDSKTLHFNNANIRGYVHEKLHILMDFLLTKRQDETRSLSLICRIFNTLVFERGLSKAKFDAQIRGLQASNVYVLNYVIGKKSLPKLVTNEYITVEHHKRLIERSSFYVTEKYINVANDLFRLCTSHYSQVRKDAQSILNKFFNAFPYTYMFMLKDILALLENNPTVSHEQFKGALYILIGSGKSRSLLTRHDWDTLIQIWPKLIQAQHSEKPSIVRLIDSMMNLVVDNLQSFQIKFTFSESALNIAQNLSHSSNHTVDDQKLKEIAEKEQCENRTREKQYYDLIKMLVNLSNDTNLHWRHADMAQSFLSLLIRRDMHFPADAIKLFVRLLIHDAIKTRKMSIALMAAVMKINSDKPVKVYMAVEDLVGCRPEKIFRVTDPLNPWPLDRWGFRPDNDDLVYNTITAPRDEESWNRCKFIQKTHHGLYCWKNQVHVDMPTKTSETEFGSRDQLKVDQCPLYDAFMDLAFVEKFCSLMSVEEKSDEEQFSPSNYQFFMGLFKVYGDQILIHFRPTMFSYVEEATNRKEPKQRLASEFVSGLVNGMKRWSFAKQDAVWREFALPLLSRAFENLTNENLKSWGTCLATIFDSRDPRQLHWLIDLLLGLAEKPIDSSFGAASRLYLLQGGLNQQEWRVVPIWHRILSKFESQLAQPYQNIRERFGSVLSTAFSCDIPGAVLSGKNGPPRRDEFIDRVYGKLKILRAEAEAGEPYGSASNPARDENILLFKTFLRFICYLWTTPYVPVSKSIVQFLPLLCYFENETSDDELKRECKLNLTHLFSVALLTGPVIDEVLNLCEKVALNKYWKSRVSMIKFLQLSLFSNFFNYDQAARIERIRKLLFKLLSDGHVEVRETASDAISGLLHCSYFEASEDTITTLTQWSSCASTSDGLTRHAGVLGLCAVVKACPYAVPAHLPRVLMELCRHAQCTVGAVGASVKKCLAEFKRTHQDSWHEHKERFSDDQLCALTDLLVSPNYYV